MGYNIEFSFNILKNSSITKILNTIREYTIMSDCDDFYEEYEFENKVQFQRRHCLMVITFSQTKIDNMLKFLNCIRKISGIYIEVIYNEDNHSILYASKYFINEKMDKYLAKDFKLQKRTRSYSDDENMILNAVSK